MAKKVSKEQTREERSKRSQRSTEEAAKKNKPAESARKVRNDYNRKEAEERHQREVDIMADAADADAKVKKAEKPTLVGRPGSGAGLKPGDVFAPSSNPGAAARVPSQPLQPESLQSHGKGILYDKDLDNPPYDTGDPEATDEGPSGSTPEQADKEAERKKAEKATPRSKQLDPDNPARGRSGRDATASPRPIGRHAKSRADVAGGSNSGVDEDNR